MTDTEKFLEANAALIRKWERAETVRYYAKRVTLYATAALGILLCIYYW